MKALRLILLATVAMFCGASARAQYGYNCDKSINYVTTVTSSTQLVVAPITPYPTSYAIHICSYSVYVLQSATPVNWGLVSGTGTNCSTGAQGVTVFVTGVASVAQSLGQIFPDRNPLNLPINTALCLSLSGPPVSASVQVSYAIY